MRKYELTNIIKVSELVTDIKAVIMYDTRGYSSIVICITRSDPLLGFVTSAGKLGESPLMAVQILLNSLLNLRHVQDWILCKYKVHYIPSACVIHFSALHNSYRVLISLRLYNYFVRKFIAM